MIRATDGQQLWHAKFKFGDGYNPSQQEFIVDEGIIYTVDANGEVNAVNASNGNKMWSFPTHQQPAGAAATSGTIYVSGGGGAYALRDGQEVWSFPITNQSAPVIAGTHLFTSGITYLHALRLTNGMMDWRYPNNNDLGISAASDNLLYLNKYENGTIYALTTNKGERIWQFDGGGSDPAQVTREEDTLYLASDLAVSALHAQSGEEIWHFAVHNQGPGLSTGVTPAGDTIYVTDNDLHALRADDGKERWNFPTQVSTSAYPGSVLPTGVIATNDAVYFTGIDNRVYSLYS